MGPTMHSPLSSSEDDLKLSQNEDNVYSRETVRQHHRRHRKQHKSHKNRRHRPKTHSSSQAEHSSRHRRHRSHHFDDQYDFEPKPQIMSSKPLVQYDDVSENDDIMDDDINQVYNTFHLFLTILTIFLTVYLNSFQTKAEVEEGEVEEEEGEVEDNGIANDTKPSREMSPNSSIDAENSVQSSRSSGNNI